MGEVVGDAKMVENFDFNEVKYGMWVSHCLLPIYACMQWREDMCKTRNVTLECF